MRVRRKPERQRRLDPLHVTTSASAEEPKAPELVRTVQITRVLRLGENHDVMNGVFSQAIGIIRPRRVLIDSRTSRRRRRFAVTARP